MSWLESVADDIATLRKNGVETIGRRAREDRHPLLARGRQEARQIERHADADDPVA